MGKSSGLLSHILDFIIEKAKLSPGNWYHLTVVSNYTGEIHSPFLNKVQRKTTLLTVGRDLDREKKEKLA